MRPWCCVGAVTEDRVTCLTRVLVVALAILLVGVDVPIAGKLSAAALSRR